MTSQTHSFYPYYWKHEDDNEDETIIRIYGLNDRNENVCVIVKNFTPYIYIELPPRIKWTNQNAQLLGSKIDDIMKDKKPLKKNLVFKKKLYYANMNKDYKRKTFPYLFCSFVSVKDIKTLCFRLNRIINIPGIGKFKYKVHEQDANPILQLVCCADIPMTGWISFKGKQVAEDDKETICKHEYIVRWKNMKEIKDKNILPRPKIMGFDIEVNSSVPSAMPQAKKVKDEIFQISCIICREKDDEKNFDNYLLTLGKPSQKHLGKSIICKTFNDEYELLLGFIKLIKDEQPNIIVGYNILGFDIPYMIDRANGHARCGYDFAKQGFHKFKPAKERIIRWSSSAFKNQEFQFLDAEGILFVDLLPLVKRDFKLSNYKLKTISEYLLKDTKDDLDPQGIFKCYRIGIKFDLVDGNRVYSKKAQKAMAICGKYCVKDSILVVNLMHKLQTWTGLCEMAKVCNVAPFVLYTQGQQIKVYSQIYKYCMYNNFVVEKDGYVTGANERFTGAHVFDPVPGVYDNVVPFDFSSLYPSTIIAYNIDYSTLVDDRLENDIPDSKCHVMEWHDHVSCFVKDTNITTNGFGIPIQKLIENKSLVISHSNKTNKLEYKQQNNWFNQGIKNCIKLTFIDGSTITCTPDHKIMTSDNEWVEAQFLLDKKVKKSITYPTTIFEDNISDFELTLGDNIFNMKNCKNVEIFCKFTRLFGFLYTDGCIQKNRATCFVGDIVDAKCMSQDIYDICGEYVEPVLRVGDSSMYYVRIPYSIHQSSLWKLGDGYGGRMKKDSILPSFITNKNCPIILKREFLAGMFGGDGLSPSYSFKTKNYSSCGLTASKYCEKKENLILYFKTIQKLLKDDFNINSYITGPYLKETDVLNKQYTINLIIDSNDIIKFYTNIGYRYCTYKMLKTEVLCSYKKYIDSIFYQREKCCKIIFDLQKRMSWEEATRKAHKIISHDIVFNNHYSLPNKQAAMDYKRRPRNGKKKTFWGKYVMSFEKYIKYSGIEYLFKHKYCKNQDEEDTIPYYNLEIIDIRNIGKREVFDIEINDNHSFLANGVVVHNCEHDPKVIRRKEIDKIIDEKKEEISKLRDKRNKLKSQKKKKELMEEINKKNEELKPFREERSELVKSKAKQPMCEKRKYRFLKEPKGVMPTVLQNLLDARKNTRSEIKIHKKEIKETDDETKIKDLTLLNEVLDKRQLAYKVSCNSMYGALGVKRGYLPFMPGAMCTTFMGRTNIEKVAEVIPRDYGGELIYGD